MFWCPGDKSLNQMLNWSIIGLNLHVQQHGVIDWKILLLYKSLHNVNRGTVPQMSYADGAFA